LKLGILLNIKNGGRDYFRPPFLKAICRMGWYLFRRKALRLY